MLHAWDFAAEEGAVLPGISLWTVEECCLSGISRPPEEECCLENARPTREECCLEYRGGGRQGRRAAWDFMADRGECRLGLQGDSGAAGPGISWLRGDEGCLSGVSVPTEGGGAACLGFLWRRRGSVAGSVLLTEEG